MSAVDYAAVHCEEREGQWACVATVTGVALVTIQDGGAWLYAETTRQIHKMRPNTG